MELRMQLAIFSEDHITMRLGQLTVWEDCICNAFDDILN